MHVHACVHVLGAPPNHPHPIHPTLPPPEPQGAQNTKIQFKSWTNQDISILFEESLPPEHS